MDCRFRVLLVLTAAAWHFLRGWTGGNRAGVPYLTVVPTSAAISDITSSKPENRLHQRLRQEAATVPSSEEEWGAPMSFKKLHYIDSAVRETVHLTLCFRMQPTGKSCIHLGLPCP
ncbi:uncharacterized protein AFUA_7G00310 [Aspergillus fumigatus Af293]|uniref:Secreted protein n=2 Tax=Aspergillus fumigatus TaxID=746128 RepID=Q4WA76_ASPFU|nr:hypothetical protein AFUA_7G00310 [Aspergillus fumigatus Af293]EAL84860.1 hypothetical protein AFUA_7G00310 [Aspergillus fumigatus Af293]EDP47981.1 hypothetical protein AFUB_086880 [Aspergillus fumigatus A1163]